MTNGEIKDRKDASTSSVSTSVGKRKEYYQRYYVARKEKNKKLNGEVKDRDDSRISSASKFAGKRKEYHQRYYVARKENNKKLNGEVKDRDDSTISSASQFAEKRKEYNRRYYAKRKENNKKSENGISDVSENDVSTSRASTFVEKWKEYNTRYYASWRENNKNSKDKTVDVSENDSLISSIERTSSRTLQMNYSQMTLIEAHQRKEYHQRYYAYVALKENRIQTTQTPSENSTSATTLPFVTERFMPKMSRGFMPGYGHWKRNWPTYLSELKIKKAPDARSS